MFHVKHSLRIDIALALTLFDLGNVDQDIAVDTVVEFGITATLKPDAIRSHSPVGVD